MHFEMSREPSRESEKGLELFESLEQMTGNNDKMVFTILFLFIQSTF